MMAAADDVTVGLLEYDPAGPRLSWVFPSRGDMDVGLIAARAQLLQPLASPAFVWSRHRGMWYYSLASKRGTASLSLDPSLGLSSVSPNPLALIHTRTTLLRRGEAAGGGERLRACSRISVRDLDCFSYLRS